MFRRLLETFQDHGEHADSQNKYFKELPNVIPASRSGLAGLDTAIQSVDARGSAYQPHAVKYPNDIFMAIPSPAVTQMINKCGSSDLDTLRSTQDPNATTRCGWLYTPPRQGSPYPQLSQGFIGTRAGPLKDFDPPAYQKWFFDLDAANKQILMDKCAALKNCPDVDQDVYKGVCGFCTDFNQGVPVNGNGQALFPGDARGACTNIANSKSQCPAPPAAGSGPVARVLNVCDPVNGRLSAECLRTQVGIAGCDTGALHAALQNIRNPSDFMDPLRNSDAVKIYNRFATTPFNVDLFSQGNTTTNAALQEARRIAANAVLSNKSALSLSAQALCTKPSALDNYDFCCDLPDSTQSPFELVCLQRLFLKLGGLQGARIFPNASNKSMYDSKGTLGEVKLFLTQKLAQAKGRDHFVDYNTQRLQWRI